MFLDRRALDALLGEAGEGRIEHLLSAHDRAMLAADGGLLNHSNLAT